VTDRADRWRFSINWPHGEEASSDSYAWPRTSIEARSSTPPDTASPAGGGSATSFGQSPATGAHRKSRSAKEGPSPSS
jgi:hypothetical protein